MRKKTTSPTPNPLPLVYYGKPGEAGAVLPPNVVFGKPGLYNAKISLGRQVSAGEPRFTASYLF